MESVVALAVLSIGMLGATRLLSAALQSLNADASRRTAVILADDLADVLIASHAAVLQTRPDNCQIGHGNCSQDPVLSSALREWHTRLRSELPSATARLRSEADAAMLTAFVSLRWPDRSGGLATHEIEVILIEPNQ